MDYSNALEALCDWALERDEVRALILTGSAAAGTAHPLSDRNIEVSRPTFLRSSKTSHGGLNWVKFLSSSGWKMATTFRAA